MGILQKKCRTTGKKALAYRGKGGQNTGTSFPALRLGVVLYLLNIARYFFREVSTPPKWCDTPLWYLVSHRHICAIPRFATYRAIIVRYPTKTSTNEFCDTIAASIARYGKYRYWASKMLSLTTESAQKMGRMFGGMATHGSA